MKRMSIYLMAAMCCLGKNLAAQPASFSTQAITKDLAYFTDWTASELSDGFKANSSRNSAAR